MSSLFFEVTSLVGVCCQQMLALLERHGNQTLMSMFGDLPGPNPNLFDTRQGIYWYLL